MAEYVWIDAVGETRSKSRVSPNLSLIARQLWDASLRRSRFLLALSSLISLSISLDLSLSTRCGRPEFLHHEWRTPPWPGRRNSGAAAGLEQGLRAGLAGHTVARWFRIAQRHQCPPSHLWGWSGDQLHGGFGDPSACHRLSHRPSHCPTRHTRSRPRGKKTSAFGTKMR